MASKREIFEAVSAAALELCEKHQVANNVREGLQSIFDEHLAPKSSGASVNLDEVTRKDEDGNIVEIQCAVSGAWLPASLDYFYEDKTGKGPVGTDGVALRRLSRQAEQIRKQAAKTLAATEKAIMADVLDGVMTPEEGKAKLEEAKAVKPDYSSVSADIEEDEE